MVAIARLSNKIKIWHSALNYSQGQREQSKVLLPLQKLTLLSSFSLGLLWYLCSVLAFCIERNFTPIPVIVGMKRRLPTTLPRTAGKISAMCRLPFLFNPLKEAWVLDQNRVLKINSKGCQFSLSTQRNTRILEESQCHDGKPLEHNIIFKNGKLNFFLRMSPYSLC